LNGNDIVGAVLAPARGRIESAQLTRRRQYRFLKPSKNDAFRAATSTCHP